MLTQERLVKIHVLETQGLSIRAIGRKLGVSRNTVRRYLRNQSLKPQYPSREIKPTKLDPFKAYMLRRVDAAKPYWIPATVMLVQIKARGYDDGYSQLERFLRPFKLKVHDPVVRFETLPGKQMQVDFTNISRGGCRMKGFVATLGFSRSSYVVFSAQERQEDWFSGKEGTGEKIWNLGTGQGYSVLEVIAAFEKASEMTIPYLIKPRHEGDLAAFWADARKAQSELNWNAKNTLEQMVSDTWRWQENNPNGFD